MTKRHTYLEEELPNNWHTEMSSKVTRAAEMKDS